MAPNRCSICDDPSKSAVINVLLATGKSPGFIEKHMRGLGTPVKEETTRRHRSNCNLPAPTDAHGTLKGLAQERADLAQLVHDTAVDLLKQGKMTVRVGDGLKATELLDKRKDRQADRDLLLNLGRLLSGASAPIPARVVIIEGEAVEVGSAGYAPPRLVTGG